MSIDFEFPPKWIFRAPYDPAESDESVQRPPTERELDCRNAAGFIRQAVDANRNALGDKVAVQSSSSNIAFPNVIRFFISELFDVPLNAEPGGTADDPQKMRAINFFIKMIYCIIYPQEYKIIPIVEHFLKYLKLEQSKRSAIRNNNNNNVINKKKLKKRFITKLIPETETHQPSQNRSDSIDVCCMVDVMNNVRQIKWKGPDKTFRNLTEEFCSAVARSCINAIRIDFIFDSYFDRSLKCAERLARCGTATPTEFEITGNTSLPVDHEKQFWACSKNKVKLQSYLRDYILTHCHDHWNDKVIVVSATEKERSTTTTTKNQLQLDDSPRDSRHERQDTYCEHLQVHKIEEADERIILHIRHAISKGYGKIFIISRDADLLVVGLYYYWHAFKENGLKELWLAKSGGSEGYHPVHAFAEYHGPERCAVFPALFNITMATGKIINDGAKIDTVTAEHFLSNFAHGTSREEIERSVRLAKEYLRQVTERTDLDVMNPSILRAFLLTNNNIHILDNKYNSLDPLEFGYRSTTNGLMPIERVDAEETIGP